VKSSAPSELITPLEAGRLLCVDPKTVSRWANAGKIRSIRTGGGHRRFARSEIMAMIDLGYARTASWTSNQTISHSPAAAPTLPRVKPARSDTGERPGAAAVLTEAVAVAANVQAEQVSSDVLTRAMMVSHTAQLTATTAVRVREARLQAAEEAAQAVADEAAQTAVQVKIRADHSARLLSDAAVDAAALVTAAQQSGRDPDEVARAQQVAATVRDAASAAAQESVEAATRVASTVAAAAALVASQVSAADITIEGEVAQLAVAVQALATAEARMTAAEADERASAVATVARGTASALRHPPIEHQPPTPTRTAPASDPASAPADGQRQYAMARNSIPTA